MQSENQLILRGNVGQDPRTVGKTVKLNVAIDRNWVNAAGERKDVTDWVTVTIFEGKTADFVTREVRKGDRVFVHARVADNSYEKDGATVYTTDVVALDVELMVRTNAAADR